jgi:hypothetical protein
MESPTFLGWTRHLCFCAVQIASRHWRLMFLASNSRGDFCIPGSYEVVPRAATTRSLPMKRGKRRATSLKVLRTPSVPGPPQPCSVFRETQTLSIVVWVAASTLQT